MKSMWDARYAATEYVYGTAPNQFLKSIIDELKPGKLLLPLEGEGRNAVYAALRGWEVFAFDYSIEGRRKAIQLAKENGVTIDYEVTDLSHFTSDAQFDLIALIYAHFDPDLRKSFFRKLLNSLSPGGVLVMEVYSKKQLGKSSGGPKNIDLLYSTNDLRDGFGSLNIQQCEELSIELNEGPLHSGLAEVVRFKGTRS